MTTASVDQDAARPQAAARGPAAVRVEVVMENLIDQVAVINARGVITLGVDPDAPLCLVAARDAADAPAPPRGPTHSGVGVAPVTRREVLSAAQLAVVVSAALRRPVALAGGTPGEYRIPVGAVPGTRVGEVAFAAWCAEVLAPAVAAERAREITEAFTHLRAVDPVLAGLMDARPDYDPDAWRAQIPALDLFGCLVLQLIGQQISLTAAHAIWARLTSLVGQAHPDPRTLAGIDRQALRDIGLSWRKAATLIDVAARFADGRLSEERLTRLPDEEIVAELTAIHGIGPWTVHGALLIRLRRADVVPTGDIMLRNAVRDCYGLAEVPTEQEVRDIADAWAPHGSLGVNLLFAAYESAENERRAAARAAEAERKAAVAQRKAEAARRKAAAGARASRTRRPAGKVSP